MSFNEFGYETSPKQFVMLNASQTPNRPSVFVKVGYISLCAVLCVKHKFCVVPCGPCAACAPLTPGCPVLL